MKKLLLIGKLNDELQDINLYLVDFFQMQLCSAQAEMISGMISLYLPDGVIVYTAGFGEADAPIFTELRKHPEIPVLTLSSSTEYSMFSFFYQNSQFRALTYPTSKELFMQEICSCLGVPNSTLTPISYEDRKRHILFVDDSPVLLRNMKAMLPLKYKVSLATSAMQAMSILGKNKPDLIFLDYEMPICNGKQTLQMIRSEEEYRSIPVVFLTGMSDKEHLESVIALKPDGYLLKPPVASKILETIEKYIG